MEACEIPKETSIKSLLHILNYNLRPESSQSMTFYHAIKLLRTFFYEIFINDVIWVMVRQCLCFSLLYFFIGLSKNLAQIFP